MRALRVSSWFLVVGLLPFWASIAIVFLGGIGRSSEYWAVAPWLIIVAVPFCTVTLAMAGVTYWVYVRTPGDHSQKLKRAGRWFAVMVAGVLVLVVISWVRRAVDEAAVKRQQVDGRVLVEQSALVASTLPRSRVSLGQTVLVDGEPVRFEYYVTSSFNPSGTIVAIVEGKPQLRVKCVIAEREYKTLQAGSDPCQSRHAIGAK